MLDKKLIYEVTEIANAILAKRWETSPDFFKERIEPPRVSLGETEAVIEAYLKFIGETADKEFQKT